MTQPPEDHLKALWQGQETETPTMPAMAIRVLARNYGDNVRARMGFGLAIVAVEVVVFGAYAWRAQNELLRAGWLIVLTGLAWMIWRIVSKRPGRLPSTKASAGTLIEFHRAELERHRTSFAWMAVTVAPVFTGMFVAALGMHKARPDMSWANAAPILVLSIAWWVAAFFMQRRQAKRLAEQIAEMDELRGG